jgi:surfeit locus 1 family protein
VSARAPLPPKTIAAVTLLALLGALFVAAGSWQWQRAADSRNNRDRFEAAAMAEPLTVLPWQLQEEDRFKRAEVRGDYVTEPQFLLDNMLQDGVAGFHVLTALRLPGLREHVLVNRGWVRAGLDRATLPSVSVSGGQRRVTGRLERLPRAGLKLSGVTTVAAPLMVLQFPTAEELGAALGEPVFEYQLLLEPGEPDGFVREWRAPGLAPERHLAYAGQWWLFAAGALTAAVVVIVRTTRRVP